MNLPAIAIEFLDAFVNLYKDEEMPLMDERRYPYVHCYCFHEVNNAEDDVRQRVEQAIGQSVPEDYAVRTVRNVSPGKDMLCFKFQLTPTILGCNQMEGM